MTGAELLERYRNGERYFTRADLSRANLSGANLSGADLYGADLCGADLREANLYEADLREANLYGANLYGADLYGAMLPHFQLCPEVGAFRAFKKLQDGVLAEIEVPAEAPRTSSLVGRKCRAAWVTVIGLFTRDDDGTWVPYGQKAGYGFHDGTLYCVGARVEADAWDDDIRVECTHGIHFFITAKEAEEYFR